ncbi:MAG: TonB-dependent receptor plug domain-containing protein, partial [Pirellulales bacterium]|nr:TonB-dependent receptor plug domain-containing protein [Pirellulales bacterium]
MVCLQFRELIAICLLGVCIVLWQDGFARAQNDAEEPTLPEVLVRPERESVVEESATDIVSTPSPTGPYDLPVSYPNLKQLQFDSLNSITRSRTSIFDDAPLTTIIRPEDLRERQPRDMIEAVEGEVGILMQRTGAGQVSPFIRGLTGPQTLILVDGIRMNNSTFRFGPNQYFATIDPGMIERIEIVRGPQSVLWGADAIGGVINVVTRGADTNFNYHGGQFIERFRTSDSGPYTRMSIEGSLNNFGVFGGASYFDAQNLDRGGDLGRQPFTNYDQYGGDIRFDYALSNTQLLTVSLQHFEQHNVPRTDKW